MLNWSTTNEDSRGRACSFKEPQVKPGVRPSSFFLWRHVRNGQASKSGLACKGALPSRLLLGPTDAVGLAAALSYRV